ncbi:MAG TPA: class II aldolase/adducin family protein, partial [Acetobacteraceae bacterium]|nr:class II aldolase/adducin family protein [Acetobacteraceae bacterium]
LARRGMNAGSSGNVSLRSKHGMLITPSGCSADTLAADDVVAMDLAGATQSAGTPSSEWAMHAAIYLDYPEAGCIVHTHADACTALACLNQPLPAFHYMVVRFGGEDVRCAPYVTFGTPELARLAVQALAGRSACLLANHGMIVHGRDAEQALTGGVLLETLCRQYLLARAAGPVRLLTAAEMQAAVERFKTYGGNPDSSPSPCGKGLGGGALEVTREALAGPLPPSPSRKGRGRSLSSNRS